MPMDDNLNYNTLMNPQGQQQVAAIESLPPIRNIVAGDNHSMALTQSGVWVWGKSSQCNLGVHSNEESIQQPYFIQIAVENASAGSKHSFIWKQNEVYGWGSNKFFNLGLDQSHDYELTKLDIFGQAIEAGMQLCKISCGDSHSLAVFKLEEMDQVNYQIFAWGESKSYQLALQTEGAVSEPILIDFAEPVKQIYSRSDFNFVISLEGDCFSWGTNLFGRLGFNNMIKNQKLPTQVTSLTKIKSISMGKYHCIAISENYEAYSWGHGLHGQLGLNQIISETTPTKIKCGQKIIQSACGEYHSVILTEKMDLMSCGTNAYHALGHNEVDNKKRCKKFTSIALRQKMQIVKIVSGNRHNLLLNSEGKVYSWGCDKLGQLGRTANLIKKQDSFNKIQDSYNLPKKIEIQRTSQFPSPFIEMKQNYSPSISESKVNEALNKDQKLIDWKNRYQKFKTEKQRQEKQFLRELEEILKQSR